MRSAPAVAKKITSLLIKKLSRPRRVSAPDNSELSQADIHILFAGDEFDWCANPQNDTLPPASADVFLIDTFVFNDDKIEFPATTIASISKPNKRRKGRFSNKDGPGRGIEKCRRIGRAQPRLSK